MTAGPDRLRTLCAPIAACALLLALGSPTALAVDPGRRISQYAHTAWRTREGAIAGTPDVVAQTTDGYLWIGTSIGLVRYDGVRFTPWEFQNGQRLSDPRVFSLLGGKDGSLWIGTGYGIDRLKNGVLTQYPQISGRIESITEDAGGTVWLVRTQPTDEQGPLCSIAGDQVRCYGTASGIPFPLATSARSANSGELWIAGYDALTRWTPGSSRTYFSPDHPRPETFATIKGIATAPDGSMWAAVDQSKPVFSLHRFAQGKWSEQDYPSIPVDDADINALFVDRDNVVWVGTLHHGIWRILGSRIGHFASVDGLCSDWVNSFYQDEEGTVWVTTSEGLDNFRDLTVTSYSTREGLSADGATALFAGRDGTVWIANFEALDALRGTGITGIRTSHGLPGLNVTTVFEDHAGRLWLGIDSGLWVYDNRQFRSIRHADGSPLGIVFAIAEDDRHSIWVRAGHNLDRIDDMKVEGEVTSPQISAAYTMAADSQGGLVLGLVNGDLIEYRDGRMHTLAAAGGDNRERQVRDLLVEPDGPVWGATLDGLFRVENGVRKNLTTRNGLPCDDFFGLVRDQHDSLWIDSGCGLIAIGESEWKAWWDHPDRAVRFQLFDALDGVYPGLTSLKPQIAMTPDGRLWFVNNQILQMIDPDHLPLNSRPPPVHIEKLIADHRDTALSSAIHLPRLTRDIEIDYTALSFAVPQRVRFRYQLEGHDKGWQDGDNRHAAFYMDLKPGPYKFLVTACNNSGVWSAQAAELSFQILPAWYQTAIFRLCAILFLALLSYAIYLLRMRQYAAAMKARFDERLDERIRIARELHDTLLQSFHGLMFRFQAARNLMPRNAESAMKVLDEAMLATEKAIGEGRDAIRNLRPEAALHDLAESLSAFGEELVGAQSANGHSPTFRVIVEGKPRELVPTLQDAVYRIGREVIVNAFRHAAADCIEVEILYGEQQLRLRIRDDGRGIEPAKLESSGCGEHWGLAGIRERAQRIGSRIEFWSETGAGTEVELLVPAAVAYERQGNGHRWRLFHQGEDNGGRS